MNVLSLFDGISCGRVALERAEIKVDKYYASEIDKYATQVSEKNYPDIIRLGDVKTCDIPKDIDILFAGFPCQSFSIAGKRKGFDDDRGNLFFDLMRIFKEVKPKYFLFENVASMKKSDKKILDEIIGVEGVVVNSALVSAQQRKRIYWTNIPFEQPEDKGLVIADILNLDVVNKREDKILMSKSDFKVKVRKNYIDKLELVEYLKGCKNETIPIIASYCSVSKSKAEHWFRLDNSSSIPDVGSWFKLKELFNIQSDRFDKEITEFEIKNNNYDMAKRIYHIDGKHPTLTTLTGGGQRKTITDGDNMFYLSPVHSERLQTLDDNYTKGCSNTQRYKQCGNGWTVDVITHILGGLNER